MGTLVERFMKLFAGLPRAHGSYTLTGTTTEEGKQKGNAITIRSPVTIELWLKHLDGETGIGIVPIRDDGTCVFGVIDVDKYDVDLREVEQRVKRLEFPLITVRSKSGGAHLYLFSKVPIDAGLVRQQLAEMAVALGFPGVEIFPKQSRLASDTDVGNWINIPYFDSFRTTRYAILNGKALPPEGFLDLAEAALIDEKQLKEVKFPEAEAFGDGPPCLQHLAMIGFPAGSRNNALFNCGVYARKKFGDAEWQNHVQQYNVKYMGPGSQAEVNNILKSLSKKTYMYMCEQPPICDHCNKDICRQRKFGIGTDMNDPGVIIESITKIDSDPPLFIISVNGIRITMSTDEVLSQSLFGKRCYEKLMYYPDKIKSVEWGRLINKLSANAEIIEAPKDAGIEGQFWYHLEQFCTIRAPARNRDELLLGKPWTEEGRTYFRSPDLIKYLEQQKFRAYKPGDIYALLRTNESVIHKPFNVKGVCVQTWGIPEFESQNDKFDIPRIPEEQF